MTFAGIYSEIIQQGQGEEEGSYRKHRVSHVVNTCWSWVMGTWWLITLFPACMFGNFHISTMKSHQKNLWDTWKVACEVVNGGNCCWKENNKNDTGGGNRVPFSKLAGHLTPETGHFWRSTSLPCFLAQHTALTWNKSDKPHLSS